MDSWESDIRKKALAARPFETQANWGKMEAMLGEPRVAKTALFMRGKQYWLIAAALLMLFGATSALTIWQRPIEQLDGYSELAPKCEDEAFQLHTESASAQLGQLAKTEHFKEHYAFQAASQSKQIRTLAIRNFAFEYQAELDLKTDNLNLAFANSVPNKTYKINRLPTPYTSKGEQKMTINAHSTQLQPKTHGARVVKDLRFGMYLTQDKIRKTYDSNDLNASIVHIHAGFGLGLMKRIKRVWEAGVRLELAEMYYYVTNTEESYTDLAGNETRIKMNLRRYLRKDVTKKIQPYVGLSSGLSKASLALYEVQYIERVEPVENPIARKSEDNPILPDGYVQYFSTLNQLPSYEIQVNYNANQYLRWENSLQLGTDIRLRPRLSLNFELGAKLASIISGRELVSNVLDNHSLQVQQNIGLQYAF